MFSWSEMTVDCWHTDIMTATTDCIVCRLDSSYYIAHCACVDFTAFLFLQYPFNQTGHIVCDIGVTRHHWSRTHCVNSLTNKPGTSHTRTAERQSWWKSMGEGEIWAPPPPLKNPLTDGHQNFRRWLCRGYLPPCKTNFNQIGLGVSFLRMRDFAPLGTKWLGYFFLVGWGFLRQATIEKRAPILTQNSSKDAVPRKEVPFGKLKTNIYLVDPYFPKKRHFGAQFRRDNFLARNRL